MEAATCRSCGASIVWAATAKGRRMPIDFAPVAGGNIDLDLSVVPPLAHVLAKTELEHLAGPAYVSHFATCPNATAHRSTA